MLITNVVYDLWLHSTFETSKWPQLRIRTMGLSFTVIRTSDKFGGNHFFVSLWTADHLCWPPAKRSGIWFQSCLSLCTMSVTFRRSLSKAFTWVVGNWKFVFAHAYRSNTGQVRIWRSSDLGQGVRLRSKKIANVCRKCLFMRWSTSVGNFHQFPDGATGHASRVVTP